MQRSTPFALVLSLIVTLAACGGGGGGSPTTPSTPPPTPAAAIEANGDGLLVLHPSLTPSWSYKLYVPIKIRETSGGTATWNFARVSLWRNGAEVERGEIGSNILAQPPDWTSIAARQNTSYALVYGFNSNDFDRVTMVLGFSDKKDGRQFTSEVPWTSFSGVDISIVPMSRPAQNVERME